MTDVNPTIAAIQAEAAQKTRAAYLATLYENNPSNSEKLHSLGAAMGSSSYLVLNDIEMVREQFAAEATAEVQHREQRLADFKKAGLTEGEAQFAASVAVPVRADAKGDLSGVRARPHYTQMTPRQEAPAPVTREEKIARYKANGLSDGEAQFAVGLDAKQ